MKIRHCPDCAQLVHFEPRSSVQKCWNCGAVSDFSRLQTPEERLLSQIEALIERSLPACSRLAGAGRVALVVAAPVAVIMLLACNSFDIAVVHDIAAPFFIR